MVENTKENWSLMTRKQRFGYFLVRFLGNLQQLCYHKIIGERVWRCSDGKCIPITKIENSHLRNIINMLERRGNQKDILKILKKEMSKRTSNNFR